MSSNVNSLVFQLQIEAYNNENSVSNLLHKAYFIARKLKLEGILNWINSELKGYNKIDEIPHYRYVEGIFKYKHPSGQWFPCMFEESNLNDYFSKHTMADPIDEIESISKRSENFCQLKLSHQAETILRNNTNLPNYELATHVEISQLEHILGAVRQEIIEWSIQLEELNILGNETSFTQKEKAIASENSEIINQPPINIFVSQLQEQASRCEGDYNMNNYNNDFRQSNIGNFANEIKDNASQQTNMQINQQNNEEIKKLASELSDLLENLSEGCELQGSMEKRKVATKAVEHIQDDEGLMAKVSNAFQAGTLSSIEAQLDHPVASFLINAIQEFLENS